MAGFMDGCYGCAHSADEHCGPHFSCRHTDTITATTGDLNTEDGITVRTDSRLCGCLQFQP